jgi:hypothetical protein
MNIEQQRAQLISTLWSLKSAIGKHPSGIDVWGYVHFMSMLKDMDYRRTILAAAAKSTVPKIRRLAEEASKIDLPGQLVGRSEDVSGMLISPNDHSGKSDRDERLSNNSPEHAKRIISTGWSKQRRFYTTLVLLTVFVFSSVVSALSLWIGGSNDKYVSGSISESVVWTPDRKYILDGLVFVESGAILTIKPGTVVTGKPGSALIITRDGSINAQGSRESPIIMTSAQPVGKRQRGDWGGLVLLGNAPINTGAGHIEGIDQNDPRGGYGGNADAESCGVLKYVRIEFAGYEISQDNELNGLTVGGCGSGTILSHIQVHMGLDDGIEFFGGTANLKYVLISRPGDDGLDWDRGWQGKGQFIIVHQGPDSGDNAIEADNYVEDKNAKPRSGPQLSNVTLVGSGDRKIAQRGLLLRRGTGGDLRNFLVTGFTTEAVDIRDQETVALVKTEELKASGWLIINPQKQFFSQESGESDDDGGFLEQPWIESASNSNLLSSRQILSGLEGLGVVPSFVPPVNSAAEKNPVPILQDEFWDEGANYIGALRPGERVSWLDGWTAYPLN